MLGSLIFFIIIFLVVYFVYYFIYDDKLKKERYMKISELVLLTNKFNLDKKKMNYRKLLNGVAIINAFIIAICATIVDALEINIVFKLLIAFAIVMILIFSLYFAYGKFLSKKWGKEK